MIRPLTLICMLLACGAGLYLYQTKHRVQLLDRDIAQTVQATTIARDRAGVLRTEWTLLNDLERLRALSDQYLQLRPVAPGQFTSLAELASRLPAPRALPPEPAEMPALMSEASPASSGEPDPEIADLPTPPVPPSAPPTQMQLASAANSATQAVAKEVAREAAREASAKAAAKATAEAVQTRAAERRQLAEAAARAQAAPRPIAAAAYRAPPSYNGPQAYGSPASYTPPPAASSLGMASRTTLPPPVPVSAYQYMSPN